MTYSDRWIFSMLIGTSSLFILIALAGAGNHWLDMLHTWGLMIIINHIRLTFSKDRK